MISILSCGTSIHNHVFSYLVAHEGTLDLLSSCFKNEQQISVFFFFFPSHGQNIYLLFWCFFVVFFCCGVFLFFLFFFPPPSVISFCLFIIWVFETKVKVFKNGDLGRFSSISQTYLQCLLLLYTTNSLAWMLKLTFQQFADWIISEPSGSEIWQIRARVPQKAK